MSTENTVLADILLAKGYIEQFNDSRRIFEKPDGQFLLRVIIPKEASTVFIYECSPTRSPISFIEIHNFSNERQMERIQKLI